VNTPEVAPTSRIRLLIADDQLLVRLGLRMVLEAQPDFLVVGEAENGRSALRQAAETNPDVILMDVRMPGMDGIEATRAILGELPACRVIVLTTFDLDDYAFEALRAGASGFLLKDARPEELAASIRSVAAGDAAISPRVSRRMLELFGSQLPTERASAVPDPASAALTPREQEILIGIADGLTNGELAQRFFLTESTIKTHVGRVFVKLQLRDRIQAVIYVYEHPEVRVRPAGRGPHPGLVAG